MTKVFVDGREGTTGLRIMERLANRQDVEIIEIDDALRKDATERARLANMSDIVFLCLPDDAARETAGLVTNPQTVVIDASTAHRTNPDWSYGLPELGRNFRENIKASKRIAVPGCHATGFTVLAYPLVESGILAKDFPFTCHSVTGHSGAGKKMIAEYAKTPLAQGLDSPRQYALSLKHKHLAEMQAVSDLGYPPLFNPIIGDFYAGMVVTIPIHARLMKKRIGAEQLHALYAKKYQNERFIHVMPSNGDNALAVPGFLDASTIAGRDDLEIFICGHDEQMIVCARFDNLGKGASGAAVQCMNIVLGQDENTGLNIS